MIYIYTERERERRKAADHTDFRRIIELVVPSQALHGLFDYDGSRKNQKARKGKKNERTTGCVQDESLVAPPAMLE